jgi:hypothetical protein
MNIDQSRSKSSPYSNQYTTITRVGQPPPTPAFGAPSLVWHVGIWPKRANDPQDTYDLNREDARAKFIVRRAEWIADINKTLESIQKIGRRSGKIDLFHLVPQSDWECDHRFGEQQEPTFDVLRRECLTFTLWWPDNDAVQHDRSAIRVCVRAEIHSDYFTLAFFIDVTKPWNERPCYDVASAVGTRRVSLMSTVEAVKKACEARFDPAAIDVEAIPETAMSNVEAKTLLAAANLLYDEIWTDFCKDFGIDEARLAGSYGEFFANFRGLVMAVDGVPNKDTAVNQQSPEALAAAGTRPFVRFNGTDNGAEPNAVLKAYWPFIRRITPFADYREFIACGMLNWRTLYVSALGSDFMVNYSDESRSRGDEVPSGFLPPGERTEFDHYSSPSPTPTPFRYLFLTKCQPHRQQIGRIVARVNAMGTMRLFALKDWSVIKDADAHIRMQGLELDRVTTAWSHERKIIDDKYPTHGRRLSLDNEDKKYSEISQLTKEIEGDLITIAAQLDKIGVCAVGGLHYRINRSSYYIDEFKNLIDTLGIGIVDSWNSYPSFIKLGLQPAFDYIKAAGMRLISLRGRLQSVTEAIQTSALVAQTTATRANTNELRKIARRARRNNMLVAVLNLVLMIIATLMGINIIKGFPALQTILKPFGIDM